MHQPPDSGDDGLPTAQMEIVRALRHRLANSAGGTFLITGFRGVGKTTAVQRALGALEADTGERVIDVIVPIARPVETVTLLFEVIRRLVERLQELGLIERLTPEVRRALLLAYARTSLAYKEMQTKSAETRRGIAVGGTFGVGRGVSVPLPRWSRSRTRSHSHATELAFLAYADSDAEHDFVRIVRLLGRDDAVRANAVARTFAWTGRVAKAHRLDARLVIVFDEIDKLTEPEGGRTAFDTLLTGLKNVLSASGVHFVVVAGMDLHDEWLRETATANSLYQSVFAWQCYTPCSWGAARSFLDEIVAQGDEADVDVLARYLEFRARGVLRTLVYELNELVDWDEDGAYIRVEKAAEQRLRLFAELAEIVDVTVSAAAEGNLLDVPSDRDRVCQLAYYVVDWALRSNGDAFAVEDVLLSVRDSVLRPSRETVASVLEALAEHGVLDKHVREAITIAEDAPLQAREQYELSSSTLARLKLIAESSPRGRAEIGRETGSAPEASDDSLRGIAAEVLGARYRIARQLGRGAFATVWLANDTGTGRDVVAKILRADTTPLKRHAEREIDVLRRISHRNVAQIREVLSARGHYAIITDHVEGRSLANLKRVRPERAVRIVISLLNGLAALHEEGFVHRDVKPSNVVVDRKGHAVLIDLGLAAPLGTTEAAFAGTAPYAAPERRAGGSTLSPAADVYSAGLVLLMLLGRRPEASQIDPKQRWNHMAVTQLPVSGMLKDVLAHALRPSPAHRYPSAKRMAAALSGVPEVRQRT